MKTFGSVVGEERLILDAPPATLIGRGDIVVGDVSYPALAPYPFRVGRNELLRHVFILGPTGSGKTTLLLLLLAQLIGSVPVMIFDFKRNYRCLLHATGTEALVVFTVGRSTAPLSLNVLQPPAGVEFAEWADALTDIISTAYLLLQGARNVLKEALLAAYRKHGSSARLADAFTLISSELDATKPGSRRYGWLESSVRTLEELTKGNFGAALNATDPVAIGVLLQRPVIFELHGFGDDQRRFFCLYFLQAILLVRKNSATLREVLQHVLVFDEAHNVFPREKLGEPSVPARLAREVREYGEAIIAATQQADISESLIANSGFKFILRCDYPRDVQFAAALLQIEPKWLPRLPIGHCIARLPVRSYVPFEFTYPDQPIKNMTVTDTQLRTQWERAGFQESASTAPLTVSEREMLLLRDVAETPIRTITQRYAHLGWNPRAGNAIKDALITKHLARFEPVPTPTGQVKILSLTDAGRDVLTKAGVELKTTRHGGAEHEYWKSTIAAHLTHRGYVVTPEYPVGGGKTVDLHATRDGSSLFVEVETGRSDIAANITKCAPLAGSVVFAFTTEQLREKHRDVLLQARSDARALTVSEISQLD
jgi:energy-coupling factor transporter ATP-binding protein EcfA2